MYLFDNKKGIVSVLLETIPDNFNHLL